MRPLSALTRLWLTCKVEGIGVVLGDTGWHWYSGSEGSWGAEVLRQAVERGAGLCPTGLFRRPACPECPVDMAGCLGRGPTGLPAHCLVA